jgi:hypothetical protein
MSTARVLLKQGSAIYRLFRFETSADGSLLAFLDRDPRPSRGGMTMNEDGNFIAEETASDRPSPSTRFSIHTTGEVHRYLGGVRKGTIHIEPLHALTRVACVGFVSIPRVSRLDRLDEEKHFHEVAATLDVPEGALSRISFAIEIGPKPHAPETFGVALDYELYSAIVRVVETPLTVAPEMDSHFIDGMPKVGLFENGRLIRQTPNSHFIKPLNRMHRMSSERKAERTSYWRPSPCVSHPS